MSVRRAKLVLLCEDSQQEAFTRRFLEGMGWNTREIRVEKKPHGEGLRRTVGKGEVPR